MIYDVAILGAGAAGLFCAFQAGRRGKRVVVLEHNARPGRKILISGGGRCNFTNREARADRFLSENPHFAKSALARYTAADFVALVERHGIRWHEKTLGQLFCDGSAAEILEMLLTECREAGVEIRCGLRVGPVERDETFRVGGVEARTLVVATGGPSIPKMGATGFAYELARQFGLKLIPPRPALVPLTWRPAELRRWGGLAGVSALVRARCGKALFEEKMLFTHRGLSGPAILQVSSYWRPGEAISIDLTAGQPLGLLERKRGGERALAKTLLAQRLPERLAAAWDGTDRPVYQMADGALAELEAGLAAWTIIPGGTEGFEKAEVTAGGVATDELSSKTMEARAVPGLFFVGECVDVTGWLGGYNFQWAWSSGFAAAQAV